ncbi:NO-inducible flavohemoprotein [Paenibacillus sp. SC116]|uniref:NO-inducible flavohemoprotein n=1 Tax=Paenibacillus sp. SC116 TaxID=2968986 RepID=UPI00215B2213|nr:NO-inducible flavohemoprotein [Paenibacillus sp. SC116]MCR8845367.1 NO-inducible flavohemoprotein [Paenibacillus sp. SC116]
MLSSRTIEIVKSTVPVLGEHGTAITKRFYALLFENHPELLNIFNHANQSQHRQQTALANVVYAAAANIDKLETLLPVVKQIGHKHRALNVKPEHYPIVGKYLLMAIKDVLGDAATDEIISAWGEAYGVIANVFIQVEVDMYKEAEQQPGGWSDYRPFIVMRKVQETEFITSFYLKPHDNGPIAHFAPGQYITVRVKPEGSANTQLRHYSLSLAPGGDLYRITVKREGADDNKPGGVVSCYLHDAVHVGDTLELTPPAGDFILNQEKNTPVVLISGGVGLTPMVSMLHTLAKQESARETIYIHATKNREQHALRNEVDKLSKEHSHVTVLTCYEERAVGMDCDHLGYIDAPWLKSVLSTNHLAEADFYFCGPVPFMKSMNALLQQIGVAADRIHFEFFGPSGSLE